MKLKPIKGRCVMKISHTGLFFAVTAMVLFTSISVRAELTPFVRHVSGEITWIDTKLGKLQLEADASPSTGEITEYRITDYETRVTNSSDEKFLKIADLQPGQHVTIDVINGKEGDIVQKITANPRPASDYQEAYGRIEVLDVQAGTLTLAERPGAGEAGESDLSSFVFEPKNVVVMQSPSREPVQLELKPGDVVKVEYVVSDGKRRAHSITLYSPRVTSTTTTTTVTTTQ
jgi:cold shock CspA family protein